MCAKIIVFPGLRTSAKRRSCWTNNASSVGGSTWTPSLTNSIPYAPNFSTYPILMRHGMTTFASPDVMRFLGHNIPAHGQVHGNFAGQVRSDLRAREEGIRIKHRLNGNSVKAYGKALRAEGSVFRVEPTINSVNDFKVYRRKEGDRKGPRTWRQMRRGIADLHPRAQALPGTGNGCEGYTPSAVPTVPCSN